MSLTEKLRPHVDALLASRNSGDRRATDVISLYEMHRRCPSDPGAPALCEAAFDEWLAALAKAEGRDNG